jgi:DNA-directed RNA polymerase subunit RPC12/RpoP
MKPGEGECLFHYMCVHCGNQVALERKQRSSFGCVACPANGSAPKHSLHAGEPLHTLSAEKAQAPSSAEDSAESFGSFISGPRDILSALDDQHSGSNGELLFPSTPVQTVAVATRAAIVTT